MGRFSVKPFVCLASAFHPKNTRLGLWLQAGHTNRLQNPPILKLLKPLLAVLGCTYVIDAFLALLGGINLCQPRALNKQLD